MFSFIAELRAVQKLTEQHYHVIFFAENGYYFQYFRYLFEELFSIPGIRIAYITSDKKDPVLGQTRVDAFYLKNTLAGAFHRLRADVMIMTMPDLQHYIFKRSANVKQYVYVFHALVSTHQQYRAHAFDHYDTIFCTSPQQEGEIREAENLYSLPHKECIPFGYPLLEELKERARKATVKKEKILIAPSWYPEGILNTCIDPLLAGLQKKSCEIWIRPHPEFIKRNKKWYAQLEEQNREKGGIHFDTSPSVYTHLSDAAYLITDRSGIALEYALATQRPVLFIDTPLKVQNQDVGKYSAEPVENAVRSRIGLSVSPDNLTKVNSILQTLKEEAAGFKLSIEQAEKEIVFPPSQWQNGVAFIRQQLLL